MRTDNKTYHSSIARDKPWLKAFRQRQKRGLQWHFARHYAEAYGWRVLPLTYRKAPAVEGGCHAATTDLKQIDAWWRQSGIIKDTDVGLRHGFAPIGVATGEASGIWVMDVDAQHGGEEALVELLDALEIELPPTLTAKTPSGGRHYYWKWPNLPKGVRLTIGTNDIGKGIDHRGEGGYAILPHSQVTKGTYEWVTHPNGLSAGMPIAYAPWELVKLATGQELSSGKAYVEAALRNECDAVATAEVGTRNNTLFWAAYSLGKLIGGGELSRTEVEDALLAAAETCGLVRDDGRRACEQTIRNGIEAGLKKPRTAPKRELSICRRRSNKSSTPTLDPHAGSDEPLGGIKLIPFSEIELEAPEWLWPSRILVGLNVWVGDSGTGKTQLMCYVISRLTTGEPWIDEPRDTPKRNPVTCVIINTESDPRNELGPRLKAAGADMKKVELFQSVLRKDEKGNPIDGELSLDTDIDRLDKLLTARPDIKFIGIDTLDGYVGRINLNDTVQTRRLLTPLSKLARAHKVSILYIIHPNKKADLDMLYRAAGSAPIIAVPRSAFGVHKKPDPEGEAIKDRYIFGPIKPNLAASCPALEYEIVGEDVMSGRKLIPTSRINWLGQSTLTLREAMQPAKKRKKDLALEWLRTYLTDHGPTLRNKVYEEGKKEGFSTKAIRNAAEALPVKYSREGLTGPYVWALPDPE